MSCRKCQPTRKANMIAKHIEKLDHDFLYEIQSAMEIRKSDIDEDYFHLIDNTFFKNGLMGAVWDSRYTEIQKIAEKHGLTVFLLNLKIWRVVVVLDKRQKLLYLFTSSKNYNDVVKKIIAGNRTHYLYLLTVNSEASQFEQLELFEDSETHQKRVTRAQKFLGNDLENAEEVAVINYDYYGNSSVGRVSFLDNTAQEIDSILLDEYFKLTSSQVSTEVHNQDKFNDTTIPTKAFVTWNPKKQDANTQESGDN